MVWEAQLCEATFIEIWDFLGHLRCNILTETRTRVRRQGPTSTRLHILLLSTQLMPGYLLSEDNCTASALLGVEDEAGEVNCDIWSISRHE